MSTAQAYPLQWPDGWPQSISRETSRFQTTLPAALKQLKKEVELLGGKSLVLSSDVTLGEENPKQKGVCAYFILRDQQIAIPCDRWNKVQDNVKAIALTIEAMRGMEPDFQAEQWEWVKNTFPGETPEGVLRHLKEELAELEDAPSDPEELADVFLLLQCLASHYGVNLMEAARAKFEKCKGRKWEMVLGVGFRHVH